MSKKSDYDLLSKTDKKLVDAYVENYLNKTTSYRDQTEGTMIPSISEAREDGERVRRVMSDPKRVQELRDAAKPDTELGPRPVKRSPSLTFG